MAALVGTDIAITVTFNSHTFSSAIPYNSFCVYNSTVRWSGTNPTVSSIQCALTWNTHQQSVLNFVASIQVPTFSPLLYQVSKNSYPFYYLSKSFVVLIV